MKLTKTRLNRLKGVRPDLVRVVKRATEISEQPLQITEGLRTLARRLVRRRASKSMNSRRRPGHALHVVALLGGRVSWEVLLYDVIADAKKQAAAELDVPLEWRGDRFNSMHRLSRHPHN